MTAIQSFLVLTVLLLGECNVLKRGVQQEKFLLDYPLGKDGDVDKHKF